SDTTTTTTPTPTSGGTSSPSTGSSTPSPTKSTNTSTGTSTSTSAPILLNDFSEYTSTTGKVLTFKVGDVFYFNLNGQKHTITVKSFDKSNLVVTIASTPTD